MPSTRRCVASPLPHDNPLQIWYCETRIASVIDFLTRYGLTITNRGKPASDHFRLAASFLPTIRELSRRGSNWDAKLVTSRESMIIRY
jgi:hypothetical protein